MAVRQLAEDGSRIKCGMTKCWYSFILRQPFLLLDSKLWSATKDMTTATIHSLQPSLKRIIYTISAPAFLLNQFFTFPNLKNDIQANASSVQKAIWESSSHPL